MVTARQTCPDGFGDAVGEQQAVVAAKGPVSQRRFDTDAGRAAGEDEVLDAERLESCIEGGLEEAAEAMLPDDNVLGQGRQLVNDVGVPGGRSSRRGDSFGGSRGGGGADKIGRASCRGRG